MTIFSFVDKAQRYITNAQGGEFYNGLAIGLCILVFLFLFIVTVRKKSHLNRRYVYFPLILMLFFGNQYMSAHKDNDYWRKQYAELSSAYNNRKYMITEGVVHVLHLEPEGGHDAGDIIQINGVEFEFSCFHNTFGYNKTIVFGGVLTEGTFARVFYYQTEDPSSRGKLILQIDLLEDVTVPSKKIDPLLPCAG
jgi:hypothetical protein